VLAFIDYAQLQKIYGAPLRKNLTGMPRQAQTQAQVCPGRPKRKLRIVKRAGTFRCWYM
jgi:hypothetical protein